VKIAILKLLSAVLVVATVTVAIHDSRSAARARRAASVQGIPAPPEIAEIERRSRVKNHLARRVIEERIPLSEAIKLFDTANGEDGTLCLTLSVPGRSTRERLCRQVILYVLSLESEMEQQGRVWTGTRVSEELQADLDRRLAAGEFPPEPAAQ
jgi:hypothetical protein